MVLRFMLQDFIMFSVLSKLLEFVEQKVGFDNTLIVLSADHGGPEAPGYLNSLNIPAGYVQPDSWDKESAINRIKAQISY